MWGICSPTEASVKKKAKAKVVGKSAPKKKSKPLPQESDGEGEGGDRPGVRGSGGEVRRHPDRVRRMTRSATPARVWTPRHSSVRYRGPPGRYQRLF